MGNKHTHISHFENSFLYFIVVLCCCTCLQNMEDNTNNFVTYYHYAKLLGKYGCEKFSSSSLEQSVKKHFEKAIQVSCSQSWRCHCDYADWLESIGDFDQACLYYIQVRIN